MKSKSSGFTLIEVLISVTILAVVATGLLQISQNSKKNFQFLVDKAKFETIASIPFMHNNPRYHNSDPNLYDLISDSYPNLDDDLVTFFKDYKIHYIQEEFATYSPLGDANESESSDEENIDLTIIYDKIIVQHDKSSSFIYKINIPLGEQKSE